MDTLLANFDLTPKGLSLFRFLAYGTFTLLIWRLWRFTFYPLLNRSHPREIPYTFPGTSPPNERDFPSLLPKLVIGHAVSMLRNPHDLLSSAIKQCKGSGEPIAITVFGQKIYYVLSEQDAIAVLREPPEILHVEHLKNLLMGLGCSKMGISEMDMGSEPKAAPLVLVAEGLMRKQLLEKSLSAESLARSLDILECNLRWYDMDDSVIISGTSRGSDRTVSLWRWAQIAIIRAVTTSWFGESIWDLSPSVVEDLVCLEHELWKLLFKLPGAYVKDVQAARDRLCRCLVDYISLPQAAQIGQSWAVKNAIEEMRRRRLHEDDMASYLLMILWGANANIFKVVFWLFAHIASNETTLNDVVTEVDTIIANSNEASESLSALSLRLEKSAFLNALYHETQRLIMNSGSARSIKKDLVINGRKFQAGAQLIVPYRQLAMSHPILAKDWDRFDPERFLLNPTLAHSKSYIPFGMGKHKCVGRFLTQRLALAFTALVVHRFQVKPLSEAPAITFTPVPSGPGDPEKGKDMQLTILPRDSCT